MSDTFGMFTEEGNRMVREALDSLTCLAPPTEAQVREALERVGQETDATGTRAFTEATDTEVRERAAAYMRRQGVRETLERAYDALDGIYGGDGVTEAGGELLEQAMARILRVMTEEVADG